MILKNQIEWALHCCSVLSALDEGKYLPTKDLAEFHGVPKEYLSKALQDLSGAGIIEGILGPKGGYRLAKAPKAITFLDIVEAVEGKKRTFNCTEIRQNNPCSKKKSTGICGIAKVMYDADEAWRDQLRAVTLADLGRTLSETLSAKVLSDTKNWLDDRSN